MSHVYIASAPGLTHIFHRFHLPFGVPTSLIAQGAQAPDLTLASISCCRKRTFVTENADPVTDFELLTPRTSLPDLCTID